MSEEISRENLQQKHTHLEETAFKMVKSLQLITNKIYQKFEQCTQTRCGPQLKFQPQSLIAQTSEKATLFLQKEVYPSFEKRQKCVQKCGDPIEKAGFQIEYQFRAWNMSYNQCLGNCKARSIGGSNLPERQKKQNPGNIIMRGGQTLKEEKKQVEQKDVQNEENEINLECMLGCTKKYTQILEEVETKLAKKLRQYL